jgi:DNA polymerase III sliding clamp (beta) subunit (PCNA family)
VNGTVLKALKFVQGAVAKKDWEPALTHFRINNGRVIGYNGTIALSSPIDLDITASPKAIPFVKAIERCSSDTTVVHMTPGGKISLRSGKFKANIDCSDDSELLDSIQPEGEPGEFPNVVKALKVLEPFISVDASRKWSNGILLRDYSAYATNNIIVVEYWLGEQMPDINIPDTAVRELIRIGEEPIGITMSENNITFHFSGDRWLRSSLLNTEWPPVSHILDLTGTYKPIPPEFFPALDVLAPFVDDAGRVYLREGSLTTSRNDGEGASIEVPGVEDNACFNYKMLKLLEGAVETIDFSLQPKPCPFRGERLRGVILGMVDA